MDALELLREQYELVFGTIALNTDGMTHADSLVQPGGGNCANWILAHLVDVQNQAAELIGAPPVRDGSMSERLVRPVDSAADAYDWDEMLAQMLASKPSFLDTLEAMDPARLDEDGFPHPFGGTATLGRVFALIGFHQAYHAGQLALARRAAGHDGAILAPAQRGQGAG